MHPFKAVSHQRQNKERNNKDRNSRSRQSTDRQGNERNDTRQFNKRPGNNTSQSNRNNRTQHKNKNSKINYHVYGKGSALEFYCDETVKQQVKTISINAASTKTDVEGYDWSNKTSIQLPRNELLQVTAVLLGLNDSCEFRQNNSHTSKSYKVEFQASKVFFMVMERGKAIRAVGLSPDDTYQVATLFLRQLKENSPWMTVGEIIDMIEMTVVNMGMAPAIEGDDEELEQPANIDDETISEEEMLDKEPNFNF